MTTSVFQLAPPEEAFQFIVPAMTNSYPGTRDISSGRGRPLDQKNREFKIELIRNYEGINLAPSDFPWFKSRIPTFSERAISLLRPFLERYGEIFSLVGQTDDRFYGLNVMTTVDALDESKSDIAYFPASSKIDEIRRPVFRTDVDLPAMFILPQFDHGGVLYVTQEYIDAVAATELPGAAFTEQ